MADNPRACSNGDFIHSYPSTRLYALLPPFNTFECDTIDFDTIQFRMMTNSQVLYNASNFLEKNRDRLGNNLTNVLQSSKNVFIKDLFTAELADTGVLSRCAQICVLITRLRYLSATPWLPNTSEVSSAKFIL